MGTVQYTRYTKVAKGGIWQLNPRCEDSHHPYMGGVRIFDPSDDISIRGKFPLLMFKPP
jgi:hypothetical protein